MRFQIDHDWQGNMSLARPRVGESTKTYLLLLLCLFWVMLGLIGHAPWKSLEATNISTIKTVLDGGSLLAPIPLFQTTIDTPPLYFLTAAASSLIFSPILSIHDGARLFNAIWISITLLMVGMTGRELWARGVGRHATFIMIGTIGLVVSAHSLSPHIALLACCATAFYALALAKRRPWRASGLLGFSMGVGFLVSGILPLIIIISTMSLLGLLFKPWRTLSFVKVTFTALVIALPIIMSWVILMWYQQPTMLIGWLKLSISGIHESNHLYFLNILIWYAWPALPLALWALWRFRNQLLTKPRFQLMLVFFSVALVSIGFFSEPKDVAALPLLLPIVALGAGSVEHLKRGAAAALNWFGIMLFGIIGFLVWLGWFAMMFGMPEKIQLRMQFLSATDAIPFQALSVGIALMLTSIWILSCLRLRQTNTATVTNWAVGMTFGWGLLMTLWLPMLDSAKSYEKVFTSLTKALPSEYLCMNSLNIGNAKMQLLHYHGNIKLLPVSNAQTLNCDLYLIEDEHGKAKMQPNDEWTLIWQGNRAADRRERFRLFQRQF